MTDLDHLERRLAAVERTLTKTERLPCDVPERAAIADDIDRLEERVDELLDRVASLEGSSRALRGYVGNIRSVNEDVTQRADAAVAIVTRLERRVESLEASMPEGDENEIELSAKSDAAIHSPEICDPAVSEEADGEKPVGKPGEEGLEREELSTEEQSTEELNKEELVEEELNENELAEEELRAQR